MLLVNYVGTIPAEYFSILHQLSSILCTSESNVKFSAVRIFGRQNEDFDASLVSYLCLWLTLNKEYVEKAWQNTRVVVRIKKLRYDHKTIS